MSAFSLQLSEGFILERGGLLEGWGRYSNINMVLIVLVCLPTNLLRWQYFCLFRFFLFKHDILCATPQKVGIDEQIGKNPKFMPDAFYRREQ